MTPRVLPVAAIVILFGVGSPRAQETSNSLQQQAIQQEITAGITNGTLSSAQIEALEAQQAQIAAGQTPDARTNPGSPLNAPGVPRGEAIRPLEQGPLQQGAGVANNNSPMNRRTTTGPDPFTYNALGPDAYQAQKYQKPGYNVPAYPTTDPQSAGSQQQYNAPGAGYPYGAGYGEAPYAGTQGSQGVYVYRPYSTR